MKIINPKNKVFQYFILFSLIIVIPVGFKAYKIYFPKVKAFFKNYTNYLTEKDDNLYVEPFLKTHIKEYEIHGIDISKHQGTIDWKLVKHPDETKNIDFIFIRATYGDQKDKLYNINWQSATDLNFTIGAYHYYWPNKNSTVQATNFIKTVQLQKGNLPPVLDIEVLPKIQSNSSWRKGIKNWLNLIETNYGIKPIIYTSEVFYKHFLEPDPFFKDYSRLWIANYNNDSIPNSKWHFWQYSDKVKMNGIKGLVDFNVYRNDITEFNQLLKN